MSEQPEHPAAAPESAKLEATESATPESARPEAAQSAKPESAAAAAADESAEPEDPTAVEPVTAQPAMSADEEPDPEAPAHDAKSAAAAAREDKRADAPAAAKSAKSAKAAQPEQAKVEAAQEPQAGEPDELAQAQDALAERTADLQRIMAEFANYRKRVERDRTLAAEQATGIVLAALLPVLDDLDRAREHGDLSGPLAAMAEQLSATVAKFGLVAFGSKGDPFDPNRHEAVAHLPSAEVTKPTCIDVMRRGYLLGERLLRPAMVAVAAPE